MFDVEQTFLIKRLLVGVIFFLWAFYTGVNIRRLPTVARYEAFLLYCVMVLSFVLLTVVLDFSWPAFLVLAVICWPCAVGYADRRLKVGVLGKTGYFRLLDRHVGGVKIISSLDDLSKIQVLVITPEELDRLAGTDNESHAELYKAIVTNEVDVQLIADYLERFFGCSNIGKPLKEMASNAHRFTLFELAKLTTEKVIAVALLIALSPIMLLIAFLVLVFDGRPIIYKQTRLGRGGRSFDILKIRTMVGGGQQEEHKTTWLGGYLRYFHLDELPQLVNILKGDMAFVGPRPEWVLLTEASEAPEDYWLRLAVNPGMTGWAQVNYKPSYTRRMRQRKLGYDVYYIKHRTFLLVSLIWLRTIRMLMLALAGKATGRYLEETRTPKSKKGEERN